MKKSIGYDLLKGVQADGSLPNKWLDAEDGTGKKRFLLKGYTSEKAGEIHPATSYK